MALDWYVAKVKPQRERSVEKWLGHHGIPAYAPEIWVVRRGRKGYQPLFPSYVFCRVDPWSSDRPLVRWGQDLQYLLPQGQEPVGVGGALVESVHDRVQWWNEGGWKRVLEPGDPVVLRGGPFRGLDAMFLQYLPTKERCRVLLSLVGRLMPVDVVFTDLEVPVTRLAHNPAV